MKPSQNANRRKAAAAVFVAALLASGVVSAKGSEPLLAFIPLGTSSFHFSPITWAAVATSTQTRSKPQAAGIAKTAPTPVPAAVLGASVSAAEAVTRAELTAALDQLSKSLRSQFLTITSSGSSFSGPAASTPVTFQSFASSQRIDQLSGTNLTSITVSGVSGLTDADIPDGITAANYLPLIGGTLTGNLTLSGVLSAGSLLVSTISSGGAIEAPYFTATSTTASSTFPNLNATNSTTTNATSTNQYATALVAGNASSTSFFSTLGRFTTGVFDTLLTAASASITTLTATTLTATNATTTRLDALEYVAVGGSATTTIRGDGVASTIPYASSTAVTVSGTASTSNLIVSTGFTFKTVTGFLKASAGIVSEALVDLAANVTGILPVANGGTGWANILSGTIPYGNGANQLATSSSLTFDGTKLIATYASTTALTSSGSAYFATSGGNVGIGTTTPASALHVFGADEDIIRLANTGDPTSYYQIGRDTGTGFLFTSGAQTSFSGYRWRVNGTTDVMTINNSGNVGIGTTNPGGKLTVEDGGTGIRVRNTGAVAGKYWFWATDGNNSVVMYNQNSTGVWIGDGGTAWNSTSDARLKTNIASLASSTLDKILSLNPVSYNWLSTSAATTTQLGFIAQEVENVFPDLVVHGPDAVITNTDGSTTTIASPFGLNYTGFIPPIVAAIKDIASIGDTFKANLIAWLADAGNDIVTIFADTLFAKRVQTAQLCAEKSDGTTFCVTGDQLANVLSGASSIHPSEPVPSADPGTSTPPTITIAGENPATIQIGDTYNDLGAIAKDNEGHELSYRTFINGVLSGDILIDTSHEATDTIDYVATDTWGNTATTTRTVIVEAVAAMAAAADTNTSTSTATSSPLSE